MSAAINLKEIRALLEMLEEHGVSEFRLERTDEKLWLKRGTTWELSSEQVVQQPVQQAAPDGAPVQNDSAQASTAAPSPGSAEVPPLSAVESTPAPPAKQIIEISSPMVGTFYRRPAVDAEPYVEVGDVVKKGDVLCIVEAMKLMNEIESEASGKIAEVCLEDGQMVEYGETLFRIEPL